MHTLGLMLILLYSAVKEIGIAVSLLLCVSSSKFAVTMEH